MRIGIVSDTHDRVPPGLHETLRGVDEILHCGDICRSATLTEIETIAPVTAVHGNCDARDLAQTLPAERLIDRGGVAIAIVHGHRFPRGGVDHLAAHYAAVSPDLILFGHSHVADSVVRGSIRLFNPGSAGGVGARPTAGILEIGADGFDVRHVDL